MKKVVYFCPGCQRRVTREVPRATAKHKSFCQKVGRTVMLQKERVIQ